MSKSTRIRFFALVIVIVVVVCGLPFLSRLSFGTRETASQRPLPTLSPSLPATTSALLPLPTADRSETGAGQAKRERLQTESEELRQANTALEAARQKAESDKARAEDNTQKMAMLTGKLLDPELKVPQNATEAGSLVGRNLVDAAKFRQKWGDSIPAAGTPGADEYAKEQETLVNESAAFLKFMSDEKSRALMAQPDGIAQFQSASLAGALGLRADQVQGISTALNGYYQQFFAEGLNSAAQPQTGTEGWQQQRSAISQQSYAAVSAFLTPEQATAFQHLYPAAGTWMLSAVVPEVPGLDETH